MATDRIEVSLPLPQPTLQRLIRAIGAAWPDATIDMSAPNEFSEQARKIAFLVEAVVDPNLPLDMVTFNEQGDLEPLPRDVNPEVIIQRIHDGSFGMAMPEWYCRLQLQAFGEILADPAAVNYVEQQMTHYNEETRSHDVYVVIVGRPKGKTPHELRVAADGRAADAVTLARKLYDLLGPDGHLAVESDFTPEERALLDGPNDEIEVRSTWHRGRAPAEGFSFSEPYQIDTTWYRDVRHPDGSVAFRCSVEGLVKHGSKLPED